MDIELVSLHGSFLSLQASKVIPHLLANDDVVIDGHCFWAGFDAGMAAFPSMGISGFIWPYAEEGQSIDEPPDIWFALPKFRAPNQWLHRFLRLQSEERIRLTRDSNECWEMRERTLSEHVVALVPQLPDHASNELLHTWRLENARQFLLLGGLDPDDATVLMSDLPIGHPLLWQEARFP